MNEENYGNEKWDRLPACELLAGCATSTTSCIRGPLLLLILNPYICFKSNFFIKIKYQRHASEQANNPGFYSCDAVSCIRIFCAGPAAVAPENDA